MSENGVIYKSTGGLYTVKTPSGFTECRARGIFRKDKTELKTGDRVGIENGTIETLEPRRNELIRPPVSNIDKLLLVIALTDPEPNTYNIDKMLAVAEYHSIEPVIIFTKSDLGDAHGIVEIYQSLPYKTFVVSTQNEDCIDTIKGEIKDSICVLSGLSGVGKSTLINRIAPGLSLRTGEISKKLQRGRHTTRTVEFYDVCGGAIADTPGFSSLSLDCYDLKNRELLSDCFPEFADYYEDCRFHDCSHTKEKACGILKAVEQGLIPESRRRSYIRMYDEMGEYKEWEQ